jgi:hypothetical protein
MYANRVVATLAPVCALAAGACATWIAEHFPGIDVPASALEEIFIAGAVVVLAPALQWLWGWQQHEKREAEAELAADKAAAGVADVTVQVDNTEDTDADLAGADLGAEEFDFDAEEFDLGSDEELEVVMAAAEGDDLDMERNDG